MVPAADGPIGYQFVDVAAQPGIEQQIHADKNDHASVRNAMLCRGTSDSADNPAAR